jgi:hypothetical protein
VHASKVQASSSPSGTARARPALHPPSPSSPILAFTPLPHSLDPSFLAATTGWAPPPVLPGRPGMPMPARCLSLPAARNPTPRTLIYAVCIQIWAWFFTF